MSLPPHSLHEALTLIWFSLSLSSSSFTLRLLSSHKQFMWGRKKKETKQRRLGGLWWYGGWGLVMEDKSILNWPRHCVWSYPWFISLECQQRLGAWFPKWAISYRGVFAISAGGNKRRVGQGGGGGPFWTIWKRKDKREEEDKVRGKKRRSGMELVPLISGLVQLIRRIKGGVSDLCMCIYTHIHTHTFSAFDIYTVTFKKTRPNLTEGH